MNSINKTILLSHGSGGVLTHSLINEVFVRHFTNPLLVVQGDSSVFQVSGSNLAFTTDSYVVNPLFFPGGDIGRLAVSGTVNDLSVSGARPLYLSAGFIIEEGFLIEELERIVQSMAATAKEAGVQIVTGDTKVVERGQCDKLFINTTGLGLVSEEHRQLSTGDNIQAGDKIVISGRVAEHGVAILCARNELGISSKIESDVAPLNGMILSALNSCPGINFMRDPTRGGVATTLAEISQMTNLGIEIEEALVPVTEELAGICELLGFDPLYIANEGKVVFVVAADAAEKLLRTLRSHQNGQDATIIGTITSSHPKTVVMKTAIGGNRVLDMLTGDQIPRIC